MTWPQPIRIVGVGSPQGDDALAWEAIRRLRACRELLPDLELHMVEGSQRILDYMDGHGTLILLDAIVSGARPGTIHRFEWPDTRIEALRPGSTHAFGPDEALRLASALGIAPPRIIVFAMEIESVVPLSGPGPAVTVAIPELLRCIVEELGA